VKKLNAIESLDRGLDVLVKALEQRQDLLVAVTADHSTASVTRLIHSGEPVPLTIAGPGVRRDGVTVFDEVSCASGCLGFLRGRELLLMLLNYADRSALAGHRLEPLDRPCVPHQYKPFQLGD
jgi:2,3-bisphosphoglycerate-independent phosphoglycerate mutase